MNTKLINTFKQLYTDRLTERGWENRKLINVLMKDVAQLITESWSQNKNLKTLKALRHSTVTM